jgi:hypothetical protein
LQIYDASIYEFSQCEIKEQRFFSGASPSVQSLTVVSRFALYAFVPLGHAASIGAILSNFTRPGFLQCRFSAAGVYSSQDH